MKKVWSLFTTVLSTIVVIGVIAVGGYYAANYFWGDDPRVAAIHQKVNDKWHGVIGDRAEIAKLRAELDLAKASAATNSSDTDKAKLKEAEKKVTVLEQGTKPPAKPEEKKEADKAPSAAPANPDQKAAGPGGIELPGPNATDEQKRVAVEKYFGKNN